MAKSKPPKQVRAKRGQVGPQTYDQVRKVADEKKVPLVKAFEEVAKATGRKASTVAVTYYRISRLKNGPARGKRGRPRTRPYANGRAAGANVTGVMARVSAAIKELEHVIAQQAKEIVRLRGESRLADRIRNALRE